MAPGTVVAQDARLRDAIAAAARTDPAETQGTSRASSRAAAAFREGQRRRNEGASPSISPSFSKSRSFFSKLFQTKLWRFCGISMGCKGFKPKESLFQTFPRRRLLFGRVIDAIPPCSVASRSVGSSAICVVGAGGECMGAGGVLTEGSLTLASISIIGNRKSVQSCARKGVANWTVREWRGPR
jgi:hypothetical protein